MRKLILILALLFIAVEGYSQGGINSAVFTRGVKFKGATAVTDTALYFVRGADSTRFTLRNDSVIMTPLLPTNFGSGGGGGGSSQWITYGYGIYYIDGKVYINDTTDKNSDDATFRAGVKGEQWISIEPSNQRISITSSGVASIKGGYGGDERSIYLENGSATINGEAVLPSEIPQYGQIPKTLLFDFYTGSGGTGPAFNIIFNNTGCEVDVIDKTDVGLYTITFTNEIMDKIYFAEANGIMANCDAFSGLITPIYIINQRKSPTELYVALYDIPREVYDDEADCEGNYIRIRITLYN